MEIVRTIMRSDLLKPVINLPWANKDLEVEVIVIPRLKANFGDTRLKIANKKQDDTLMSKKEYFAKFERGLQSIKEGKGKKMTIAQVNEILGL